MATNSYALPALSANASFFKTIKGAFTFGASAAPIYVSTKILSWNLTVTQNPSKWWLPGNPAGQEDLLTKNKVGKQGASGSVTFLLEDAVEKALFEANTECEFNIVLQGELIGAGPYYHTVWITIPHFKIPSEAFGNEQDQVTYTLPFSDQTILKVSGSDYISMTVRGIENASKLLVAA